MSDQAHGLRELLQSQAPAAPVRIIAVTSGKGGVGKTNVSLNLAIHSAQAGKRVLLIDADLGLANVEVLCGLTPQFSLVQVLDGSQSVDGALARGPAGVRVLSAGSGTASMTQLDDQQKLKILSALDALEDAFDVVIIDTGAGIGENVRFFVSGAQEALLVVGPEPTALTDAYAAVKVLSLEAGVEHFNVVVNQVRSDVEARSVFDKLTTVTRRFLKARVKYLGFVPRDEHVPRAVMAQRPVLQLYPAAPASRALASIGQQLFDAAPPGFSAGGLKFLWRQLFKETPVHAG